MLSDVRAFRPNWMIAAVNIAVTAASQFLLYPGLGNTAGKTIRMSNIGSDTIYVRIATSKNNANAATTATPSMVMLPNTTEKIGIPEDFVGFNVIGAVGGTSNFYASLGEGN
jgi:hypothetical protein